MEIRASPFFEETSFFSDNPSPRPPLHLEVDPQIGIALVLSDIPKKTPFW